MLAGLGCVDANDLCRLAATLINSSEPVREAVAEAHPHLLVDEAEQLTPVRAGLLAELATGATSLVAAIDPSSGSDPEAAMALVEVALPGADRIRLDRAWAIGADQIEVARAVLSQRSGRNPESEPGRQSGGGPAGDWLPADQGGCEIRFWRSETAQAEAQGVAREIELMVADGVVAGIDCGGGRRPEPGGSDRRCGD